MFRVVFGVGLLLMAAGMLLRPKRTGVGWGMDFGFSERATALEKVLFLVGLALALCALLLR
ncbi:MAG: hypothetical protein ACYTEZ_01200 [Planctomycetota bacterium]|jgi:hypothetical protein